MKQGTLIKISWSDAGTINTWEEMDDLMVELQKDDFDSFYTVGFFIKETKRFISVAQTVHIVKGVLKRAADTMSIPKCYGLKIKKL